MLPDRTGEWPRANARCRFCWWRTSRGLRQAIVRSLHRARSQVDRGRDVAEAIARRHAAVRYDLLLLDVNLPDATGWDVLRELRSTRAATVPVVVLSAVPPSAARVREFRPRSACCTNPSRSTRCSVSCGLRSGPRGRELADKGEKDAGFPDGGNCRRLFRRLHRLRPRLRGTVNVRRLEMTMHMNGYRDRNEIDLVEEAAERAIRVVQHTRSRGHSGHPRGAGPAARLVTRCSACAQHAERARHDGRSRRDRHVSPRRVHRMHHRRSSRRSRTRRAADGAVRRLHRQLGGWSAGFDGLKDGMR